MKLVGHNNLLITVKFASRVMKNTQQPVSSAIIQSISHLHLSHLEAGETHWKDTIRKWAYLRYLERQSSGMTGTAEEDWFMGEQLALIEREPPEFPQRRFSIIHDPDERRKLP